MPFYSYVFVALLAMSGAVSASLWESQSAGLASAQEVSAASMRFMSKIVSDYMRANPAASGEISDTALAPFTPSWFKGDSRLRVAVQDGRGYIFIVVANGERIPAQAVIGGDEMPVTLGIATNGQLVSPVAGTVLLSIPTLIPNGSLVYVI